VNEADKSITFRIETSTYPNFNGTEQKLAFTLVGDELTYTVPAFSGGGTAVAKWKRAK
jgi:Lipocalin-like domain